MKPIPNQIIHSDSRQATKSWPSNCIDTLVTDPPYGLGFMGKEWDHGVPGVLFWREFLRITKPGGILLCFGGTRTFHRLTCAIENAGWEIRDCMMWLYGSGFPKSHNIGKAIEKMKVGGIRNLKKIGTKKGIKVETGTQGYSYNKEYVAGKCMGGKQISGDIPIYEINNQWGGYGTALKPAWEPIIVAMKPLDGTFAANAEKHGVAGLNIDGGRIGNEQRTYKGSGISQQRYSDGRAGLTDGRGRNNEYAAQGRWPANLILDEESAKMLDEQSGTSKSPSKTTNYGKHKTQPGAGGTMGGGWNKDKIVQGHADSGGASRFFYCAKAGRKERNMGLGLKPNPIWNSDIDYSKAQHKIPKMCQMQNSHPTVKPLALMKYLCTLLKMPGQNQIILDPFMGSGTTGIACADLGINFIGIDKEFEYCEIAQKRIAAIRGITLPISKNVETFRATKDFAGGSRRPNENLSRISEHRQSIINAASAKLRNNK